MRDKIFANPEALYRAIEKAYAHVGGAIGQDGYEGVMRFLLMQVQEPGPMQEILRGCVVNMGAPEESIKGDNLIMMLSALQSQMTLKALVAQLAEREPATSEWVLKTAKALPLELRAQLLPLAKKLPHGAGRTKKLSPQEEIAVCKKIDGLVVSGIGKKETQRQVAAQEGVSLRTIQRIRSSRGLAC